MLNLILLLPLLASATLGDKPHIFRDLSLDEAVTAATQEKKLVILDAMTSWCGPCRQMDATTWRDPELVPWLSERAVCIQLDMDKHTEIKRRLAIRGFPTMVAFRDGVAFDQILGFKSAAQIRTWVEGLSHGTTDARRLLGRVEAFREMLAEDVNIDDRRAIAENLLDYGHDQTSAEEYLWLWNEIPQHAPHLAAWRWEVLPSALGSLASRVESVRAQLSTQRLALRPLSDHLPSLTKLRDWIELNHMLGDDAGTTVFCGAALEVDTGRRLVRKLDQRLFPLFIREGDWRAAGLVLTDPLIKARRTLAGLAAYDRSVRGGLSSSIPAVPLTVGGMQPALPVKRSAKPTKEVTESTPAIPMLPMIPMGAPTAASDEPTNDAERALQIRRLIEGDMRNTLSLRYAALLSANRDEEAVQLAELLLEHLDDARTRTALVAQALAAGVAQKHAERHIGWLRAALK